MTNSEFFSNFFVVEDPISKKNYRGEIINKFDEFGKLLRAEYKINHLDIKYLEGSSEPSTLFWNMVTEPFCISQAFADKLNQSNITGWSGIPTTVLTKSGNNSIDNYLGVAINGRANTIDYLKTDIIFKQLPGRRCAYFKGLYFDPESWDGSDIFMTNPDKNGESTSFVYVTKKIVDSFKKNKVTNIRFINFNDYITDCEMIKIGADEILKKAIDEKIKKACA